MPAKETVFISCGQVTDEEKQLGAAICRMVRDLTVFEPYFAEYQSSLDGLSQNILGALEKAIGLIAILHPRGTVTFPDGSEHVRASVWDEQEIAVAAYLRQIAGKELKLAAYAHRSVSREGMRQQLQLNPQIFSSSEEVLSHLSQLLPLWTASKNLPKGLVEISLSHRCLRKTQELHEYNFGLTLINHGADVVEDYFVEIEFPRAFLDETTGHIREVRERLTESHRFFRVTNDAVGRPLFPGDPVPVFTADYFVDQRLYRQHNGEFHEIVTATLYIPGQSPSGVEARMQDLQNF